MTSQQIVILKPAIPTYRFTAKGGSCTNAWPMLTGSRNQFIISRNVDTGLYRCMARYNTKEERWTDHTNSPHDSLQKVWSIDWPKVGGGGILGTEISSDELFQKIVAWDKHNYLIGAGTSGWSDKESTDGIIDNHAYSVIDTKSNVCNTGIDLLLVRNPWGKGGELENGTLRCCSLLTFDTGRFFACMLWMETNRNETSVFVYRCVFSCVFSFRLEK